MFVYLHCWILTLMQHEVSAACASKEAWDVNVIVVLRI